jgi:predicted lipoprotein with Yx(FWY)xxD motif
MTRSRPIAFIASAVAVPFIALGIAACGGGSNDNNATAATAPPTTASGQAATLGTASAGSLGTVLVDSKGDTLYLFQKDTGTKSTCAGACASAWPPLRASGKPTAGSGANASMLGTTPRSDGKPQVTYNGHPLYTYSGDQSPGDTSGEGVNAFGGLWYAVSAAGNQIVGQASGSSSSGGGGGFSY